MNNSKATEFNLKLYCLHYNECDPKKCTALKLKKFDLLKIINKVKGSLNKALTLNPFSKKEVSIDDRKRILKYGLIVIDCSWKTLLNIKYLNNEYARKLPPLMAANPVNYGRIGQLSSIEALASALYISDFEDQAKEILSLFKWGESFMTLNESPLAEYKSATSNEEVYKIEKEFF